jgi:predicted nucleic-acid-binding Zn-ribbon protein
MEKLGVVIDEEKTKTASKGSSCPKCGGRVYYENSYPKCEKCGTEPFEKKPNPSK